MPPHLRLSDTAIADIAGHILGAVPLPAPDDQTTWMLSRRAELRDEDEGRAIHALAQRVGGARRRRPS